MDTLNTATATYETPMAMLRRVLPTVGMTLSSDADYMYRALRKPGMKNGELKAAILAWLACTELKMASVR